MRQGRSLFRHAAALLLSLALIPQAHAAHRGLQRQDPLQRDVSLVVPSPGSLALYEPVPGAPVSSTFGWRLNPVLQRVRFHAGIDFAAPVGAPVLASGEGRIVKIARARDRGLYVVIRHVGEIKTAYSHLSSVVRGLRVGQRIKARQLIGAVGMSGRTSGPHLDFEVYQKGKRVDPAAMLAGSRVALAAQSEFAAAELQPVSLATPRAAGPAGDDNI